MSENPAGRAVAISVRGVAFAETSAERATVAISVGFDGADRGDVRARSTQVLAECVDSIVHLHDAVDGPVVEWTADDLQVWAERPWNADSAQLPLVYHSRAVASVTFIDFTRLGLWLEDVADRDGVTVGGITWTVTDLARRELEARAQRDAVAHALDKASVYAASLGLSAATPVELSEPSILAQPFGRQEDARMFAMSASAPVDFTPAPVRVDVEILAKFTASESPATV